MTTAKVKQRIALRAAAAKIAIYSPHTALDAAVGGVNDWLAQAVGKGITVPITPTRQQGGAMKLVTFAPAKSVDKIRDALSYLGAGQIGDYSQCSFSVQGQGTFLGGASTQPVVGQKGLLEKVEEVRLEMVIQSGEASRLEMLLEVLRQVHPYEEPAFDVYPLTHTSGNDASAKGETTGQGRVVALDESVTLAELAQRVARRLGVSMLEVARATGKSQAKLQRVGVCVGAGGSLLSHAGRLDAFITGEMRHHDVLDATNNGTAIILAGHTQTERPFLKPLRKQLLEDDFGVSWQVSRIDRPPGQFESY